jgi:hypothetical protein
MSKPKVTVVVGTPGSGKTWVTRQLADSHTVVEHDVHGLRDAESYARAIAAHAASSKPVVAEAPFSLSKLTEALERRGFEVKPVFITESAATTRKRYEAREGKPIPQGHLTRIEAFKQRAAEQGAPAGTASEILNYLKTGKK